MDFVWFEGELLSSIVVLCMSLINSSVPSWIKLGAAFGERLLQSGLALASVIACGFLWCCQKKLNKGVSSLRRSDFSVLFQ